MTARLDAALCELAPLLERDDPTGSVEKVDVAPDGGLRLAVLEAGRARWFGHDDRGIIEQLPSRDARIPLASRLRPSDEILAYRPGRRLVIARDCRVQRTIVKGFRRKRSEEAARLHRIAERAGSSHTFRIPRLYFHASDVEALVYEELVGRRVRPISSASDTFFCIGVFLSNLQAATDADLKHFTEKDELDVLERWRSRVELVLSGLPDDWVRTLERVRAVAERLPESRVGLCHRDLHDGQLLEVEGGLALLDFDLLCHADTALDPANLLAHLTLRSLQSVDGTSEASARTTGEAFLEGLRHADDHSFGARLRFYQATSFLRLALVYAIRPRWSHLSSTLTQLGSRCTDEVEARC